MNANSGIALVALCHEYCVAIDGASSSVPHDFVRRLLGLLPRIYITAFDLPAFPDGEEYIPPALTEEDYVGVSSALASVFGENDTFLETFHEDMKYSDTPIASSVSELLADLYQTFFDFTSVVRDLPADSLDEVLGDMAARFKEYWSENLCNALKVLNYLYMNDLLEYDD